MRNKLGILFMTFGLLLIAGAAGLFLYNQNVQRQAADAVEVLLPKMQSIIAQRAQEQPEQRPWEEPDPRPAEMTAEEIDGHFYIGYVSMPALGLELPVMAQGSDSQLRLAPCRQYGSAKSGDLVIAGLNYKTHFGTLHMLRENDTVTFTDMDGAVTSYLVKSVLSVDAADTDYLENSGWQLVLYTCTYGNGQQIAVCCVAAE